MNEEVVTVPETLLRQRPSVFQEIIRKPRTGWRRYPWLFWALIGPGILATMANNDAGGMISYAVTGGKFGIGIFMPLVFIGAIFTFVTQEFAMRLCIVTQTGFTRLIRQHFGRFWLTYHIATLTVENLLMLITEFIGMTAGLLLMGLPLWLSDVFSLLLVLAIIIFTGYWTKERIALFLAAVNIVFVISALMTHPSMAAIGHAFVAWNAPAGSNGLNLIWYIVALFGNSVAPWAIFFQGSSEIDKGVIDEKVHLGRIDTVVGTIITVAIAAFVIIGGAALFGRIPNLASAGPADMISGFINFSGRWAGTLFAIALFNTGFLAAICVGLSSSWSMADAFGWAKSLNDRITEAPKFYAVYIGTVILAAAAVLIPNLPLNFTSVIAQVGCGLLMIPILVFLLLLTNNKQLMGKYKNSLVCNIRGWLVFAALTAIVVLPILNTFGILQ
jgi:Mn2+/Fe2+ NRAMP family transporter